MGGDAELMSFTARTLHGPQALTEMGPAFDALCLRTGAPITSRRPWLQTWVRCYPQWAPWLVVLEREGELVGCAPFARRARGGRLQHVVGLGHGPTDELHLLAEDQVAADALADAVVVQLRHTGQPWLLHVEQLRTHDPVLNALAARLPRSLVRPAEGQPTVQFPEPGAGGRAPADYLSRNTRKVLAKIRNKMIGAGLEPDLAWTSDPEQIRSTLPDLRRVHRARDVQLGRRSDHDDPSAACFYEAIILELAGRGEVELLTVRLAGELAGYVCAFSDGRTLRSWDNRLAPAWAEFSAGRLANTEALHHVASSSRWDELDWMQGEEGYKLQSATQTRPMVDLFAWSSPAVQAGHRAVERARTAKRDSDALTKLWWRAKDLRQGASDGSRS